MLSDDVVLKRLLNEGQEGCVVPLGNCRIASLIKYLLRF